MSIDSKFKNPWIQILRAISVLVVIAYHFQLPVSNGFIGVDIFFVISGYVITQSLIRSSEASWFSRLKVFYIKRIARLFPAFLVVFMFTIISSILFLSPNIGIQQNAIKSSLGATLGISNFVIPRVTGDYFGATGSTNPFQHTWSLSVEEQFYFVFPLIFLLFIHKKIRDGNFNSPIIGTTILTAMSFSILLPLDIANRFSNFGTTEYFAPQNRAWEFLAGAIVALVSESKPKLQIKQKTLLLTVLSAALVFISVSNLFAFQENLHLLIIPVSISSIFLLISDAKSPESEQMENFSGFRNPLVLIGDWSYSLYLWHWPIWIFTKLFLPESGFISVFLASMLTLSFSALTYRLIEKKFSFAKKSQVSYWIKFFLIGQTVAISLFFIGFIGVSTGWGKDWALSSHKVIRSGCDNGVVSSERCLWGKLGNERMAIIGDSMSWAIADPIIHFSLQKDLSVRAYTKNGCAAGYPTKVVTECEKWQLYVASQLMSAPPKIVVIASSESDNTELRSSFESLLNMLYEKEIPTLVVLPPSGGDEYSSRKALLHSPGSRNRSSLPVPQSQTLSKIKSTIQRFPNARYFDPTTVLCQTRCKIAIGGKEIYNYGKHLSVYGSWLLADALYLEIDDVLSHSSQSKTNKASM